MDRSVQMQAARQAEDDMQAALFHNDLKAQADASGEPLPPSAKSQSVVNIDRIQLLAGVDKKEAKRAARVDEIKATYDTCKAKAERIKTSNPAQATEADGVLTDLEAKHNAASMYLGGEFKEKLDRLRDKGKAAQSPNDLKDVGVDMAALWKEMNKGVMEEFIQYCKRFNQASSSMNRATKTEDAESKRARADAPRPPLFTSLFEGVDDASVNCSSSVFEAKGGLASCQQPWQLQPSARRTRHEKSFKKCCFWLERRRACLYAAVGRRQSGHDQVLTDIGHIGRGRTHD
jgi:hypothetical protein